MEVLRRCPLAIAQRLVHRAIALSTAVLDRVTKTMSVAPLLTNNLDNSKQKTSNLLSPAPPPYSWSLLGKSEGPAPPPSSKISLSFDLAWNPALETILRLSGLYRPPTPSLHPIYIHITHFLWVWLIPRSTWLTSSDTAALNHTIKTAMATFPAILVHAADFFTACSRRRGKEGSKHRALDEVVWLIK